MKIRQIVKARLDEVFGVDNYRLVCIAIAGSHAYGMQTATSDYDVMGLFLPPENYIIGMDKVEQVMLPKSENVEGTLFSFQKWFKLMFEQNPNVLELLWHTPTQYVYKDEVIWPMLFNTRDQLLSKKLKHSFAGYSWAQMNRLDKLNEKVNENPKRLAEFKKFGYSTKNASHMFRLINMAFDALVDKEIQVMRPERQFLISVREGAYTYEEVIKMVNTKFTMVEEAYMRSDLRNKIDYDFANNLHISIIKQYLKSL